MILFTWIKNKKPVLSVFAGLLMQAAVAGGVEVQEEQSTSFFSRFSPKQATIPIQVGFFSSSQGNDQDIGISGLIGDHFTVNDDHDQNILLGLGYYIDGFDTERINILFGVNAFYLAHTSVEGTIYQEHLFPNLAYSYSLTNFPIYAAAKAEIKTSSDRFNFTLDAGIGPNIIRTSDYKEWSIDGGMTLPDHAFSGHTNTAFSATAGVGIQFNNLVGQIPLECGYRFFYSGQGHLNKDTNQILDTLNTGTSYANAIICSASI